VDRPSHAKLSLICFKRPRGGPFATAAGFFMPVRDVLDRYVKLKFPHLYQQGEQL